MPTPPDPTESMPTKTSRGFQAFYEGIAVPFQGLRFMERHPRLWRYGIWPVLLNLVLSGLLLLGLLIGGGYFVTVLHPQFSLSWWGWILELLTILFLLVLAVGVTFGVWLVMQVVFCGYFYGKLAEEVERRLGMKNEEFIGVPLVPQIYDTLHESLFLGLINLVFLLVQFVPVVGPLVGIPGCYYFTCLALGREYWDYPLSLRGHRRSQKYLFAKRHRLHTLGLGTAVFVLFLIPLANAVLLTTAVTGVVLLHRELIEKEKASPSQSH